MELIKVGELARRTGLSVRTLHYYDEIGLLSPSHHTPSGHRLYGAHEAVRLQQIRSLQALGFTLEEIRGCLKRPDFSPRRVIELHLRRLREQIESGQRLCARLEAIAAALDSTSGTSLDDLLQTIEEMIMFEKYYTPEQLKQLEKRRQEVGEERIRQAEREWRDLFADLQTEMEKGSHPSSKPVQRLMKKYRSLIEEFTGGDPGIHQSLSRMYRREGRGKVLGRHGFNVDEGLWDFIGKAGPGEE